MKEVTIYEASPGTMTFDLIFVKSISIEDGCIKFYGGKKEAYEFIASFPADKYSFIVNL